MLLSGLKRNRRYFDCKIFFARQFGQKFTFGDAPAHIKTDLSLSLFDLAKELKKDPQKLAEEAVIAINLQLGHSMSKLITSRAGGRAVS